MFNKSATTDYTISIKKLDESYTFSSYTESKKVQKFKKTMCFLVDNLMLIFFVLLSFSLLIASLFV